MDTEALSWYDTADEWGTIAAKARDFSTKSREKYADKGVAMDDGSFPIPDRDALGRAIKLAGNAKDPNAAKAHIRKRAKALHAEDMIPDSWSASMEPVTAASAEDSAAPAQLQTADQPQTPASESYQHCMEMLDALTGRVSQLEQDMSRLLALTSPDLEML